MALTLQPTTSAAAGGQGDIAFAARRIGGDSPFRLRAPANQAPVERTLRSAKSHPDLHGFSCRRRFDTGY